MQSCLRVLTTKVDNLKITVTQLCPKFIINPNYLYLLVEEGYLLVEINGQFVQLIVDKEDE